MGDGRQGGKHSRRARARDEFGEGVDARLRSKAQSHPCDFPRVFSRVVETNVESLRGAAGERVREASPVPESPLAAAVEDVIASLERARGLRTGTLANRTSRMRW